MIRHFVRYTEQKMLFIGKLNVIRRLLLTGILISTAVKAGIPNYICLNRTWDKSEWRNLVQAVSNNRHRIVTMNSGQQSHFNEEMQSVERDACNRIVSTFAPNQYRYIINDLQNTGLSLRAKLGLLTIMGSVLSLPHVVNPENTQLFFYAGLIDLVIASFWANSEMNAEPYKNIAKLLQAHLRSKKHC